MCDGCGCGGPCGMLAHAGDEEVVRAQVNEARRESGQGSPWIVAEAVDAGRVRLLRKAELHLGNKAILRITEDTIGCRWLFSHGLFFFGHGKSFEKLLTELPKALLPILEEAVVELRHVVGETR